MKQVIAIAFSDLHINNWSRFNANGERTQNSFRVLSLIKEQCIKHKCPALFCGDLFHKPESIDISLLSQVQENFDKLEGKWKMYAISGNHDMINTNSFEHPQESWMSILSGWYGFLHNLDFQRYVTEGICLYGIPYIDHNLGLNEMLKKIKLEKGTKNILLLHSDYPGATNADGEEIGSVENLNIELLQKFDLVLIGHIHLPQRFHRKVTIVGAPYQQSRSDSKGKFGYWEVYWDDKHKELGTTFVDLDFPKFIDVESEDQIKDDGNYYTLIAKQEIKLEEQPVITRDLSKRNLVKSYLSAKGITDPEKKKVLTKLIKEAEE